MQSLKGIARHIGHNGIGLHIGSSTGQVRLLHRTITNHHYFFQIRTVFLQGDVDITTTNLHFLALEANIREHQCTTFWYTDLELTVEIGHCTHASVVFYNHAYTNKWLSRVVLNHTAYSSLLLNGSRLRDVLVCIAVGTPNRWNEQKSS